MTGSRPATSRFGQSSRKRSAILHANPRASPGQRARENAVAEGLGKRESSSLADRTENVGFTREGNMAVTRRGFGHLAFAGAVAFGASTSLLSRQSLAEAADQAAVDQAVEALRKALLDRDVDRLRDLLVDELSYGLWPGGRIQNKYEFIGHIAREEPIYNSIAYSDPSITIAGNNAIVRHRESIEAHTRAKRYLLEFGVLQVWQKQDDQWRLLARQGWKPEIS